MAEKKLKKFVFSIEPENVDFIESLSYHDKQNLVNHLISEHKNNRQLQQHSNQEAIWLKKFITYSLVVIIGIPLLLILLSFSFKLTKNSYMYMQTNFEKLYSSHQTENRYTY